MSYLDINLTRLNAAYGSFGISFVRDGAIIKMYRTNGQIFQTNPDLKSAIRNKVDIIWNGNDYIWYMDERGIEKLGQTELKFASDRSQEELKQKLVEFTDKIEEESLKTTINEFLESHPEFYSIPAATTYHHAYENGLLEHTVQVCEICDKLVDYIGTVTPLDKDLVYSGAILHDIGKINCYDYTDGVTTVTDLYKEQNHIINGVKEISTNITSEKLDKIIHIIASHHQSKDNGSPVSPANVEAWLVHTADNLSAKTLGG